MQAEVYNVTQGRLGGGAEDLAGGVGGDGVAAFENAEGAAFVELEAEAIEAVALLAQRAIGAGGEFELEFLQTQANRGNLHSEIKGDDTLMRDVEALGPEREICAEGVSE